MGLGRAWGSKSYFFWTWSCGKSNWRRRWVELDTREIFTLVSNSWSWGGIKGSNTIKFLQECVDLHRHIIDSECLFISLNCIKAQTRNNSRSRNPITTDYTLKGHTLTTEGYTKYLGVELQSTFSWNRQINQTVKKANSMVGFLRWNLRVSSKAT